MSLLLCKGFVDVFAYIFVGEFPILQGQKTNHFCYRPNLVSEPLVYCLKSTEFSPDFYHSFSIPSFSRFASKITITLVFYLSSSIFYAVVSGVSGSFVHRLCIWKKNYLYTRKKNCQHSQDAGRVHYVGYQGSTCRPWHPNLSSVPHVDLCFDFSFFMGSILKLYRTQGLFIICPPDTDVTENSCSKMFMNSGSQKIIYWIFKVLN